MELFKLLGTIAIDTDKANQAIDDTTNKAEDSADKQTGAFSKIGSAAATLGRGMVTVGGIIGGALIAATEGTREYRVSMGMLVTAFETAGHSADVAKSTYSDLNAVLRDAGQATEAAQQLAKLTDNEKELNNWTNILTGVYATFGESLPVEGLAEAANHTAKIGEVQGSLADALEWSGISVEGFNDKLAKCSNEQERQELITKTMNELYGEAAQKYKEVNKDVIEAEKAQEKLTGAFAEVGAVVEPVMTDIKTKIAEMVELAAPKIEDLINKVKYAIKWFKENKTTVDVWAAVILGAATSVGVFLLILNWGKIMAAAVKALKAVRTAVLLFNATLMANPIALIVALIAGLVVAFIYLWNNCKPFRQFWIDLWKKVKSAAGTAVDMIKDKFEAFKGALKTVKKVFGDIKDNIVDKLETAKEKVKSVIDKIKGFFDTTLKFKGLKMPSISLTLKKGKGIMAKAAELLGLDGVPKFSVKWNAQGGIFDNPTIFATPKGWQGVGEAGAEAITPISTLQAYIDDSVNRRNQDLVSGLENQVSRLISFMEGYFPTQYNLMLDSGILAGQLAPEMDYRLAEIYTHSTRGNTR